MTLSREGFSPQSYNYEVENLRDQEYPCLKGETYLDHGGSTIPAKSLLREVAADLSTHLYGNPHSASAPSALAGHRVDEIREQALRFFDADPEHFDLVFVANATAAMKLVMDAFKDHCEGTQKLSRHHRQRFWYAYHRDAHNSLIGIREAAEGGHRCFGSDQQVEDWIRGKNSKSTNKDRTVRLFGYCGQSNMTGRRLPRSWPSEIRHSPHTSDVHTLFDAAALATTAPLDLSNPGQAPDFTCLSFYKIFGSPDLGALIIRKASPGAQILASRRYFGGGTDGTLAFHSIIALSSAFRTHARLFKSMRHVSAHTTALTAHLYKRLSSLRHINGRPLVAVYNDSTATFGDAHTQGATIAFNVMRPDGTFVAPSTVERAANARNIYLRSGSLCNPGGAAKYLGWTSAELFKLYEEGLRCSRPSEVVSGRPTGVVRCSLGAVSIVRDVETFLRFLEEVFGDCTAEEPAGAGEVPETEARTGTMTSSVRASAEMSVGSAKAEQRSRRMGLRKLILSCLSSGRRGRDGEEVVNLKER
ncbi:Aminotransferase class V/Cysteine desulfurase [Macrophomina phaseolina MS6]|uniref:Aminotransferase class V/Cysteine desulfurase n=1 Tax=Macrophomina phaseolina (strain MS6) TaxID=1126212 RepID=K2S7H9_MACPH|nr:Aminotransferase class V/Cysteine desulfurase [Macrophomina phaseolina MS6]